MIDRLDLLCWLSWRPTLTRDECADAYAGLIAAGLLIAGTDNNSDAVVSLTATPAGRAKIGYVLPAITA